MKRVLIFFVLSGMILVGINSVELKTKYDDMEQYTTYEAWTDTQMNFVLCVPKNESKLPFMKFWVEIPLTGMTFTANFYKMYTKALAKNDLDNTIEINMEGGTHVLKSAVFVIVERINLDLDNTMLDQYSKFFNDAKSNVKVRFSGGGQNHNYNLLPVQIETVQKIFAKYDEVKKTRTK